MAYTLSTRKDGGQTASTEWEFASFPGGWAPGALEQTWISPPAARVVIACAVFEDGTGDGDPAQIREITERWRKQREAVRQILPSLEDLLRHSDAELPAAVEQFVSRCKATPCNGTAQPGCIEYARAARVFTSNPGLPPNVLRQVIEREISTARVRIQRP